MKQKTVNRLTNIIEDEIGSKIEIISMETTGKRTLRTGLTITVLYRLEFRNKTTYRAILTINEEIPK